MHGGREGEDDWKRCRSRHMRSVPATTSRTVAAAAGGGAGTSDSVADSFSKDGRKIRIGDCALFKPPQDSPPFIGIIGWLKFNRENNLQLGVNWLYRPGEVKLGKGILLEAAPNEIFYSFHKDEIPAASLLHPCKVAFLPKGAELPPGVSSFVCRRVYDIANKCLWWLTDQDYIDERQEEVNKLLYKTRTEMQATVQPGGRSPKPINGPSSTSQLKAGSDNVTNNSNSFPSQVKGKKRERGDQGSEPVKRERSSKLDDSDPVHFKLESVLKTEIAKITEKGGLVDSEGVEKLVQLMQPVERKLDLMSRSMLAGVISSTEKLDCLSQFVQLKGLPVLDEWLQDVNKGKVGDGTSTRDGDKSAEEFLLVILRALDKLPVNLPALQMCNIGKSVNHLRTHKNWEIQKKARSLVDTWKKRVEAEMNIIDAKSRLPEVSHCMNRQPAGSSEFAVKSSVMPLASKSAAVKPSQTESNSKSSSLSPGQIKSGALPASGKDGQPRLSVGSASDLPSATAKEEKSSSSSQSHNYSLSFAGKEDARSSTAGSMSTNKISSSGSRHRKSNNGLAGSAISGIQRESGSSRNLGLNRNLGPEKLSQSGLTSEKAVDVPSMEVNSPKLIVKIPNRGRSPAQSVSGGTFEDHSIMNSRASSPVLLDKHDEFDHNLKDNRNDITSDVNAELWQSNDFKDLTGSDEGDGSPAAFPDEERCRTGEDMRKLAGVSKAASLSAENGPKEGKLPEASFCSINALIESCVKDSEANATLCVGDDVGMNLLASVAAGEMSKSDYVSPTDTPLRNSPTIEDTFTGDFTELKSSPSSSLPLEERDLNDGVVYESEKLGVCADTSLSKDNLQNSKHALGDASKDRKSSSPLTEEKQTNDINERAGSSYLDLQPNADSCVVASEKPDEVKGATGLSASPSSAGEKAMDCEIEEELHEEKATVFGSSVEGASDNKTRGNSSLLMGDVSNNMPSCIKEKQALEISSACLSTEFEGANTNDIKEGINNAGQADLKSSAAVMNSDGIGRIKEEKPCPSVSGVNLTSENDEFKVGKAVEMDRSNANQVETKGCERGTHDPSGMGNQLSVGSDSTLTNQKSGYVEGNIESQRVMEKHSGVDLPHHPGSSTLPHQKSPLVSARETRSRGSKFTSCEADEAEECTSRTADDASFSAAGAPDMDAKVKFDLNEGLVVDDGRYGEPISSSTVQLINSLPFSVASVSSSLPASITVAAAAKGPFVLPEDLLRSKGELGWKGSAATSAFRPAEPRKIPEIPVGATSHRPSDVTDRKYGRPLLDIDLNVPDERVLEDMASRDSVSQTSSKNNPQDNRNATCNAMMGSAPVRGFGGLDLDLNRVDETNDAGQCSTSCNRGLEVPLLSVKPSSSSLSNGEIRRDFDLNNGPVFDDGSAEPSFNPHGRGSMQSQTHVAALRMSNADVGSYSPCFPPGNNFPTVPVTSILPDRGEQPYPIIPGGGPQRMLGAAAGPPFSADVYRGSVLSSSSAVPFPSTTFQYPIFPFGTAFPLPSANFSGGSTTFMDSSSSGRLGFPPGHSQLLGPAAAISSHFPRPYMVSLPDGNSNGSLDNNRKWGRQGLDLNAGPGCVDLEAKEEALPLASQQLSASSSQTLADEQARMYQAASGVLKRKEPDGGWDAESFRYKQSSWQ